MEVKQNVPTSGIVILFNTVIRSIDEATLFHISLLLLCFISVLQLYRYHTSILGLAYDSSLLNLTFKRKYTWGL